MATATAPPPLLTEADPVILHHVAWETYCQLRDEEANNAIRMIYLDGELTLMSPAIRHDGPTQLLAQLVRAVTTVMGGRLRSVGSTTLRRQTLPITGVGKEPDVAFYLGDDERRIRGIQDLDLEIYPPPTLAIEVDSSRDSTSSLSVYARLGVPEIWRYSVAKRSIWIGRLDGAVYREVARSVALPKLTPDLIVTALNHFDEADLDELAWFEWVKVWASALPEV